MSASLPYAECTNQASSEFSLRRLAGFTFGIGTQALFAITVVGLFSFLRYGAMHNSGSWIVIGKRPGNPFRFAVVSRQHRRRGEDQG